MGLERRRADDVAPHAAVRQTVLVVDDEPRHRALMKATLGGEHHIIEAGSAVEAFTQLAAHDVDLILLDAMMPGESGIAALPRLKMQTTKRGFIPVLVLSALVDQADRNDALTAGADDVLNKPIDAVELRLRVRTFLQLRAHDQVIRQQRRALERDLALKDDLFGLLVHDLRNPLTSVLAMLQVLHDEAATPAVQVDAAAGLVAAHRFSGFVEDILQLMALEAGQIQVLRSAVSLAVLAREIAAVTDGTRAGLLIVDAADDVVVHGDRALLRRALETLVVHALNHAPAAGPVVLEIGQHDHRVVVSVSDWSLPEPLSNGPGHRRAVLGQHIVELVAKAHDGVTRRIVGDNGSTFVLELPAAV